MKSFYIDAHENYIDSLAKWILTQNKINKMYIILPNAFICDQLRSAISRLANTKIPKILPITSWYKDFYIEEVECISEYQEIIILRRILFKKLGRESLFQELKTIYGILKSWNDNNIILDHKMMNKYHDIKHALSLIDQIRIEFEKTITKKLSLSQHKNITLEYISEKHKDGFYIFAGLVELDCIHKEFIRSINNVKIILPPITTQFSQVLIKERFIYLTSYKDLNITALENLSNKHIISNKNDYYSIFHHYKSEIDRKVNLILYTTQEEEITQNIFIINNILFNNPNAEIGIILDNNLIKLQYINLLDTLNISVKNYRINIIETNLGQLIYALLRYDCNHIKTLLTILKNPIIYDANIAVLDLYIRNNNIHKYNELISYLEKSEYDELKQMCYAIQNFHLTKNTHNNIKSIVREHVKLIEKITIQSPWRGEEASVLADFFRQLMILDNMNIAEYEKTIEYHLNNMRCPHPLSAKYKYHINFLSPSEAIISNIDYIFITNCNFYQWPINKIDETWLSRTFQEELLHYNNGGFNLYNFASILFKKNIYISYSQKINGLQMIKSRFLDLLEDISDQIFQYYEQRFIKSIELNRDQYQLPTLSEFILPKKIGITQIYKLIFFPYDFFVEKILYLDKEPDLEESFSKRDYGIILHEIFAKYTFYYSGEGSDNSIINIVNDTLKKYPYLGGLLRYKIFAISDNFMNFHKQRGSEYSIYPEVRAGATLSQLQDKYQLDIIDKDMHNIEIISYIDRLEMINTDYCNILDYKTGALPTNHLQILFQKIVISMNGIKPDDQVYFPTVKHIGYIQAMSTNNEINLHIIEDNKLDECALIKEILIRLKDCKNKKDFDTDDTKYYELLN